MTTETIHPVARVARVLLAAAGTTLAIGLALALVGALVAGREAALGALAGTLAVVVVFGFGAFAVNLIAAMAPHAALMVALLTYTLQVVAMALFFVAMSGSGLLDEAVDRQWLSASIIVGTFVWIAIQVVLTTRDRSPVYDIPLPGPSTSAGG